MIEKVTGRNIEDVLPLIKEYQVFYGVEGVDEDKNRLFFSQFTQNHDGGILHLYRVGGQAIGFTTVYSGFSSTRAEAVAVLNDVYVQPSYRGKGYASALVANAFELAKARGFSRVQWLTAQDNVSAQHLYDRLGAKKSTWVFYAKET